MKNRLRRILKKLKNSAGFSLTELLACTIIMLLASSALTTTITLAAKRYDKQVDQSKADILCDSISYTLRDKLSGVVKYKPASASEDGNPVYYSTSSGLEYYPFTIEKSDKGEIYLQYTVPSGQGDGVYNLINKKSYFDGKFVAKYNIKTVPATVSADTPLDHFVVSVGIYDKSQSAGSISQDATGDPNALSFVNFIVYPVTHDVAIMK